MTDRGEVYLYHSSSLAVRKQRYEYRSANVSVYVMDTKQLQKENSLELHNLNEETIFTF